jgi:hypothetical protein
MSRRDFYKAENANLISDHRIDNRVVFFGTQVILEWDLNSLINGYEKINRGVDGQRAAGYLLRFQPDVIALNPEAVVIEMSSYNFRPDNSVVELQDYITGLIDLARFHGIIPIPATVIPPTDRINDLDDILPDDYIILDSLKVFNDWLRLYCADNNLTFIDLNRALAGTDGYMDNNYAANVVEPNETGYIRLSGFTQKVLDSLL